MKNDFWVLYKKIHYTCNVSLRRIRTTAVTAENQYYVFCVHVLLRARVFGWVSSIQCACAISSVVYTALQYFCSLSQKLHELQKKITEHKMCVWIFCVTFLSETHLIIKRTGEDMIIYVYWYSCKVGPG